MKHRLFRTGRHRRWWQRAIRAATAVAILAWAAYTTLPYWVPNEMIRRRVERMLSEQAGVPVTLRELDIRWEQITARGLRIAPPEGFGQRSLATAREIRLSFEPLSMLLGRDFEWMEIDGLVVSAKFDEQGNSNLRPLSKLQFDSRPERVSVQDSACLIHLPDANAPLRVSVGNIEYLAGRIHALGEVTLSAALLQEDSVAPITARLTDGRGDPQAAAAGAMSFANIDLEQLYLPGLLGLPLRELSGRLEGQLELRVNPQGRIDRFHAEVVASNFQAEPVGGPDLGVIDRAGLSVTATWDPLTDTLTISDASLELPRSIHLQVRGTFQGNVRASRTPRELTECIRRLEVSGEVHPSRLALLLTGSDDLGGGLAVHGPVQMQLSLAHDGPMLDVGSFRLDAEQARVEWKGRVAKPAGLAVRVSVRARVDDRTLRVEEGRAELRLAGNALTFSGSVRDLRDLPDWIDMVRRGRWGSLSTSIGGNLQGQSEILLTDLDPLKQMHPAVDKALAGLSLGGPARARGSVQPVAGTSGASRLRGEVDIPAEVKLAIGRVAKPIDQPLRAVFQAETGGSKPGGPRLPVLRALQAELSIGDETVSVAGGELVQLSAADRTDQYEVTGRFHVSDAAPFARAAGLGDESLAGSLGGDVMLRVGQDGRLHDGKLRASLTDASVHCRPWLSKPAGSVARVDVRLSRDPAEPLLPLRGEATLRVAGGKLQAGVKLPDLIDRSLRRRGEVAAALSVYDAAELVGLSPALADLAEQASLRGMSELKGQVSWNPSEVSVDLQRMDMGLLSFRDVPAVGTVKARGVPLRVSGEMTIRHSGRSQGVDFRNVRIRAGDTRVRLNGWAPLPEQGDDTGDLTDLLKAGKANLLATLHVDDVLRGLHPQIDRLAEMLDLSGSVEVNAGLGIDKHELALTGRIDAGRLAGRFVLPALDSNDPNSRIELRKPDRVRAQVDLDLLASREFDRVRLRGLSAAVGDLWIVADANGTSSTGDPADLLENLRWRGSISTLRLASVATLIPRLKSLNLTGALQVEVAGDTAWPQAVAKLLARSTGIEGRYNGRAFHSSGELHLTGIDLRDANDIRVDRIQADQLEFRAGRNHLWVFADIADPDGSPTGTVKLVGEYLDDRDLLRWLAPLIEEHGPLPVGARDSEHFGPEGVPQRLSGDQARLLELQAQELLRAHASRFRNADLEISARLNTLRAFDASVNVSYEITKLTARGMAEDGVVKFDYHGVLSGGSMAGGFEVDLAADRPAVAIRTDIREVIGSEKIQPQLAVYFPGNKVGGTFTRAEESKASLIGALSYALDPRYPLIREGSARTVTTEGVVTGRAAPKFVTRVFPNLDLAEYEYRTMHSFTDFLGTGVAENDMIFDGVDYDLYMQGTTDANNNARYTVGLILVGQDPEWNHAWKEGRLPLLKVRGHIEGGKLEDREVSFFWLHESLFEAFLKNNRVYQTWRRKRSQP